MSKDQSTDIATVQAAPLVKRGGKQLVEILSANTRPLEPTATVRFHVAGQASVDLQAEKHAQNLSKSYAKQAGRMAYRMACIDAGFPDPEAK